MYDAISQNAPTSFLMAGYVTGVVQLIVTLLFICSVRKAMKSVTAKQAVAPKWFLWLLLLPVVSGILGGSGAGFTIITVLNTAFLVFAWIMIPFAIPNSLARHYADKEKLVQRTRSIQRIGIWMISCLTVVGVVSFSYMAAAVQLVQLMFAGVPPVSGQQLLPLVPLFSVAYLVLFIIYWCKISAFTKAAS
jgi:hypothetical protein